MYIKLWMQTACVIQYILILVCWCSKILFLEHVGELYIFILKIKEEVKIPVQLTPHYNLLQMRMFQNSLENLSVEIVSEHQ
jgi:hypothetical protein